MGGRHTRKKVLRLRYRDGSGVPKSRLVMKSSSKRAKKLFDGGTVFRVRKVGIEEMFKIGEHSDVEKMRLDTQERFEAPPVRHYDAAEVASGV